MRKLQNWYFQNKNKTSLRDAKVQEKIVDKMIYDYKVERINKLQTNLEIWKE